MFRPTLALAISVPLAFSAASAHGAVIISSDATQNMSCSNGVCAPMAANAVLNAGDLETLLASGNVAVVTAGQGVQAKDIKVKAAVTWSSGSVLTLDAFTVKGNAVIYVVQQSELLKGAGAGSKGTL